MNTDQMKTGYKKTVAGIIPEDWNTKPLGEVAQLRNGFPFLSNTYTPLGKYKVITIANVQDGYMDIEACNKVPNLPQELQQHHHLDPGDILISMTGNVGRVCRVKENDCLLNQRVGKLVPLEIEEEFLFFLLRQRSFLTAMIGKAKGGAQGNLSNTDIVEHIFAIPPDRHEQQAIATSILNIESLLDNFEKLISKKRDIQKAATQQLLTGQRRLPGFSREWAVKRLGDHLSFLRNGTNSRAELSSEGDVHYLHYGDIHGSQYLLLNPAKTSIPCLPRDKAKRLDRLKNGDLVFADASEDLDGVGKSVEVQLPENMELVSGLHTIAVRFDKEVMADGFKAYLQFIPTFRSHLRQLAAGTKVYATNRTHIASAELKIPDIEEQAAIATILSDMDTELAALEARRDKARQLKQGMMQELLTGRVRLA